MPQPVGASSSLSDSLSGPFTALSIFLLLALRRVLAARCPRENRYCLRARVRGEGGGSAGGSPEASGHPALTGSLTVTPVPFAELAEPAWGRGPASHVSAVAAEAETGLEGPPREGARALLSLVSRTLTRASFALHPLSGSMPTKGEGPNLEAGQP